MILENVQTILVFKDDALLHAYNSEFSEFLEKTLTTNVIAFNELVSDLVCLRFNNRLNDYANQDVLNISDVALIHVLSDDQADVYSVVRPKKFNHTIQSRHFNYARNIVKYNAIYNDIELSLHYNHVDHYLEDGAYTHDDILILNESLLPLNYAINEGMECLDSEGDNFDADCLDLSFSNSCGYYNNDEKVIMDRELRSRDDVVTLSNGDLCDIDDAVFIESEGEYYHTDVCVYCNNDNTFRLERNCIQVDGSWYDRESVALSYCEECNECVHVDNAYYIESEERTLCECCYENVSRLSNRMSYSTNVLDHHSFGDAQYTFKGHDVYLGFELETKAYDSDVNSLDSELYDMRYGRNSYDYCVPTEDGSLDSQLGVEYIFIPDSIDNHRDNIEHFIDNVGNYTETSAGNGYGLHVHVSDNWLSENDKLKIQNFVSVQMNLMQFVGGRGETSYQSYKVIKKHGDMKMKNRDRYQAVNLTAKNTIEFRFPVSLVDQDHIVRNLQLAFMVCLYCKFELSYTKITDTQKFIDFVKSHKDMTELNDYLSKFEF